MTQRQSTVMRALAGLLILFGASSCRSGHASDRSSHSGGDLTIFDRTSGAFRAPAPNLDSAELARHRIGDVAFEAAFVSSPAPFNPGLGPFFNDLSCRACHQGDGRGRAAEPGAIPNALLLRVSVPGAPAVPRFGAQLQLRATVGFEPEATAVVSYVMTRGQLADGTPYELRAPRFEVASALGALPADLELSPRLAPPVFGLGLLEAVSDQDILARADPDDRDGDGISGRPNYAIDATTGERKLGRFGWKAGVPSLLHQSALAYSEDMGITSAYFPAETCRDLIKHSRCEDHDFDLPSSTIDLVTWYVRTLAVPARRGLDDRTVRRGEATFRRIGCASCHVESMRTAETGVPRSLAGQSFRPYTDLLLHDMGDGLADGRPDGLANGREWRTPPLWGIGLTRVVNGHTSFLHDGRARNLLEAILWHAGEADAAATRFRNLSAKDRAALLAFLESL